MPRNAETDQGDVTAQSRSESPKRATFHWPEDAGRESQKQSECHDARDFREAPSSRLHGAAPETIAEIQQLTPSVWEYYKPEGILEELLVQKIVVETARYGRVVALEQREQPEPGYNLARVVHCLDRTSRYSTATSRALSIQGDRRT